MERKVLKVFKVNVAPKAHRVFVARKVLKVSLVLRVTKVNVAHKGLKAPKALLIVLCLLT